MPAASQQDQRGKLSVENTLKKENEPEGAHSLEMYVSCAYDASCLSQSSHYTKARGKLRKTFHAAVASKRAVSQQKKGARLADKPVIAPLAAAMAREASSGPLHAPCADTTPIRH